jgi:phosphate-selective porin OprO/OprP
MTHTSALLLGCVLLSAAAEPLAAQPAAATDSGAPGVVKPGRDERGRSPVTWRFRDRPSLGVGRVFRLDLTARVQGDVHRLTPVVDPEDEGFDFERRRLGVAGRLGQHLEFEVERELAGARPWRDAFVNLTPARALQLRAGQFKIPFGLDQLTSGSALDFVHRSRVGDLLAPGRSLGVSVHGRAAGRGVTYDVGLFGRDGDNARFGSNPGAGATAAGRATFRPFRLGGAEGALRALEVGVNASSGRVPEGRYSLRGRLTSRDVIFAPVFVNGRRTRLGADTAWSAGRLKLRAEVVQVRDERIGQGLGTEDLPPLTSAGWYVSGLWRVAGDRDRARRQPGRRRAGVGAIDVGLRFEWIAFGSEASGEPALRNPRAAHLLELSERALSVGVNWQLNRWTRVQLNAVRERVNDPVRTPAPGQTVFWAHVVRMQFAM